MWVIYKKLAILSDSIHRNVKKIFFEHPFNEFPRKNLIFKKLFFGFKIIDKSNGKTYFPLTYQESKKRFSYNEFYQPKIEILKGILVKKAIIKSKENSIIPIGIIGKKNFVTFEENNHKTKMRFDRPNNYYYIKNPKNSDLEVSSKRKFILANDFNLLDEVKTNKKLVIQIFIDGLGSSLFEKFDIKNYMPKTIEFFEKGIVNSNCYSNAEWTLPSSGSLISGLYPSNHGLFNSKKNVKFLNRIKLTSEYFSSAGYNTFSCTSNFYQSPLYGYYRGFDRLIYKHDGFKASEIIDIAKEHLETFDKRSNYLFLSFFDLHDVFYSKPPEISVQINNEIRLLYDYNLKKANSILTPKDDLLIDAYLKKLKWLDTKLADLYGYISSNYSQDDYIINLISDHGQSYFDNNDKILSSKRTKVFYMLKHKTSNHIQPRNLIQNTDVLPTLLDLVNIKYDINDFDGISIFEKNNKELISISQSIFPGQTYKACLRTNSNEYYLETTKPLRNNLIFKLSSSNIEKFDIVSHNKVALKPEDMEFVKKSIIKLIETSSYLKLSI